MAEEKIQKVIVKARAMAFLTTEPEEEPAPVVRTSKKKYSSRSRQNAAKAAAEEAAAQKKREARELLKIQMVDKKETIEIKESKSSEAVTLSSATNPQPVVRTSGSVIQNGALKKVPKCKTVEPLKRPADATLIISAKKKSAEKKIGEKKSEVKEAPAKVEEKVKDTSSVKKEEKVQAAPVKKEVKAPATKKETVAKSVTSNEENLEFIQSTYIEFMGTSYLEDSIVKKAETIWTDDLNNKLEDMKSLELYVKPEENAVYYVFNKKDSGSFAL